MTHIIRISWNKMSKWIAFTLLAAVPASLNAQYYDNNQGYYDNNPGHYDDRYDNGDYSDFYDQLSPHGSWMQDPQYGYVWRPNVGRDFRPYYTNGRWAMTDLGNMWVSNYIWGSIPFHYGRWVYSNYYGWLWIPGRQWAPAWVVWRQGSGYYGWAPMGPSISINFNFGNYYNNHYDYWTFIPNANLYYGNYHSYRYSRINSAWFGRTTIINNYHTYRSNRFFAGPRHSDVRRYVRDVPVYRVSHTNTRGRNTIDRNSIRAYTPQVGNSRSGRAATPRNFTRIENDRRIQYEYGRNESRGRGNRVESNTPANNRVRNNRGDNPNRNTNIQRQNDRNRTDTRRDNNNRNRTIDNNRSIDRKNTEPRRNSNPAVTPQNNRNIERRQNDRQIQQPRNNSPQQPNRVQQQPRQRTEVQQGRSRSQQQPSSGRTNVQPGRNTNVNRGNSAPSGSSRVQRRESPQQNNVRQNRSSVQPSRSSTTPSRSGSSSPSRTNSGRGTR